MISSINNYLIFLKKLIIKNELKFLYLFLFLAIFNNVSHFIRKNLLGDRIDFWDFHVYWCSANKFISGINPYGGDTIKNCLSQFNFDLYFSYPPIVLKSISFLGYLNFTTAKIIWILIIAFSFFSIIFYLKKIYNITKVFHFVFVIIFIGGGIIWGALLAGNISILLYGILTFGIYNLIKKNNDVYYLSVLFVSLFKFPFLIFFVLPIFLNQYKELKKIFIYLLLTFSIYYIQFYLDKQLFISFINSTTTYKSENFLYIHGTGIGIHGLIDLYQNLIYEKINLQIFKPSGIYSFFIHTFISVIFLISSFFLFKKKNSNLKQKKLLISFFIVIFLCCFPRISSYDFFLIISSLFYIVRNSRIRLLNYNWKFIFSLLTISAFAIYDTRYPAFVISFILFTVFYLHIKQRDPFFLKNN